MLKSFLIAMGILPDPAEQRLADANRKAAAFVKAARENGDRIGTVSTAFNDRPVNLTTAGEVDVNATPITEAEQTLLDKFKAERGIGAHAHGGGPPVVTRSSGGTATDEEAKEMLGGRPGLLDDGTIESPDQSLRRAQDEALAAALGRLGAKPRPFK